MATDFGVIEIDMSDGEWNFRVGRRGVSGGGVLPAPVHVPKEILLALTEYALAALEAHDVLEMNIYRTRAATDKGDD